MREQNLRVMDPTAIAKCMEHDMPILVFNFRKEGNIERAVNGERVGTLIARGKGRDDDSAGMHLKSRHEWDTLAYVAVLAPRPSTLRPMTADEILLESEERMEKAIDVLKHALAGIRTGRANPGLVDSLRVEAYGSRRR